jgi:hypothetical protein
MKKERRKHQRRPTHMPASIVEPELGAITGCTVQNLSRGGAKLLVGGSVDLPGIFWLRITGDAELRYCNDIWRSDRFIGIDFAAERAVQSVEEEAQAVRKRMRLVNYGRARNSHWASVLPKK